MLDSWAGTLRRIWAMLALNAACIGLNAWFWVTGQNPLFGFFAGWHLCLVFSSVLIDRMFLAEIFDRINRWKRAAHDAR